MMACHAISLAKASRRQASFVQQARLQQNIRRRTCSAGACLPPGRFGLTTFLGRRSALQGPPTCSLLAWAAA